MYIKFITQLFGLPFDPAYVYPGLPAWQTTADTCLLLSDVAYWRKRIDALLHSLLSSYSGKAERRKHIYLHNINSNNNLSVYFRYLIQMSFDCKEFAFV